MERAGVREAHGGGHLLERAGGIAQLLERAATAHRLELDPYGVFANDFAERIGVRWPKRGENFATTSGVNACACGVLAEPVCEYKTRRTFANVCRASCQHVDSSQLVPGTCAQLEWDTCSVLDSRTCVWRKQGAAADRGDSPLLAY